MSARSWPERFHDHLDGCPQCREHPGDLCPTGHQILVSLEGDDNDDLPSMGEDPGPGATREDEIGTEVAIEEYEAGRGRQ